MVAENCVDNIFITLSLGSTAAKIGFLLTNQIPGQLVLSDANRDASSRVVLRFTATTIGGK